MGYSPWDHKESDTPEHSAEEERSSIRESKKEKHLSICHKLIRDLNISWFTMKTHHIFFF